MNKSNLQIAKYLLIDTETTGLFFSENGLIQCAGLILDKQLNEIGRFCTDICPDDPYVISAESIAITGFTQERINAGISYQDFCEYFLDIMKKYFPERKPVMIAQFVPFDYSFLYMVFGKKNMQEQLSQCLGNDLIDTKCNVNAINLMAELRGEPVPFPNTSLSKPGGLKDRLGIDQSKYKSHDALGDCEATLEVLKRLTDIFSGEHKQKI